MSTADVSLSSTSHVSILNDATFSSFVEANSMVLVLFIYPFLPRCKRFAPIFEKTAQTQHDFEVRYAQISRVENEAIFQNFQISTYPTLILFRGFNNVKFYRGALREKDIVSYLNRQSLPTISTVVANTLECFKEANDVVVLGYFAPNDSDSEKVFASVAESLRDEYLFGKFDGDALSKAEQIEFPGIAIYKTFDNGKNICRLTNDANAMTAFVTDCGRPLVVEFLPELHEGYMDAGIPLGYIFATSSAERARLSRMVAPLAKKHKGEIQFGTVEAETFGWIADDMHINFDHWPAFAIREPVRNLRFPLSNQHTPLEHVLGNFVETFLNGELEPTMKSQPLPKMQENPIIAVVALNYDDIVINNEKDVFIEFYIPRCGPCKAFLPTYEKLAQLYAANVASKNKVTIARLDAEANDIPDRDVRGFPTFKLFPAGSKKSPLRYLGARTLVDMVKFIKDNGKHKVDIDLTSGATE